MKCKKIEKWLSDRIDGESSEKVRKEVEDHLQKCSSCRAYQEQLERIQAAAKEVDYGRVSPEYWEGFPSRIKERLISMRSLPKQRRPFAWDWRWAWIGTGLALAIFIGLCFFSFWGKAGQEVYVFSFEDSMAHVFREIGDNSELAEIFNAIILESIGESFGEIEEEFIPGLESSTFPEEEFWEEELINLDSEINEEIKS